MEADGNDVFEGNPVPSEVRLALLSGEGISCLEGVGMAKAIPGAADDFLGGGEKLASGANFA
jgi:hypothetical protein